MKFHAGAKAELPSSLATTARRTLTPNEQRFFDAVRYRWPEATWRRYAPVTIPGDRDLGASTWYAPFLNIRHKLIVVIEHREDFSYRVYGENRPLYERYGYRVLDFTQDLGDHPDPSVWEAMLSLVGVSLS